MMHAGAGVGNSPPQQSYLQTGFGQQPEGNLMGHRLVSSTIGNAVPVLALLVVAIFVAPAYSAPKASGNPFDTLKGYWTGGGTVSPVNGKPEKVSCHVTYNVAGSAVSQTMRCAGTDYKINTSTKLTYTGGKISGSWNESTYDASGGVSGTAGGNTVHARISGDKFSGRMSINISGKGGHSINIVEFDKNSGAYRPVANVSLRR
ncbi:MAG: hypothetical protein ACXWJ4_03065 [Methyloceanibacter sp.]